MMKLDTFKGKILPRIIYLKKYTENMVRQMCYWKMPTSLLRSCLPCEKSLMKHISNYMISWIHGQQMMDTDSYSDKAT